MRNFITITIALAVVCGLAMAFGHSVLSPEVGIVLATAGAVVLPEEVKNLIEQQGRAFEEFKKANDERLKSIETKGFAPADLVGKVDVINGDLNKLSKQIADALLAAQRPNGGDKGVQLSADEVEHKNALNRYMRSGDDTGLAEIQKKAMNSTSDPDGGYLVRPEMDAAIDRVVGVISAMARLARTVTVGSRSWQKRVKTSGMTMRRVAEGSGGGETTEPKFALLEIVASPAEVEPWVQNATLEDADVDLEADLTMEAGIAFAEGEGSEFITGDGVNKARGITGYTNVANASYAWGKIGYIASGKSGAFASVAPADKLIDLQHALKAQYRNGAVWLMADTTLATVRQMKDGSGAYYLWQPDPLVGFGGRLLGAPVEIDDNMPAVGANSFSVAFGNFQRGYAIVRRRGTTLIRDNVTTKGVTKFNFTRRFGGGVYNFEAIKLMKFATS